ncbi:MAG TPA: ABC transporter substrate-binding protein [Ilumatobacteraceae bacterium]|nr:ABC transporter substrate-binding protein [Ilumatobacteraceae bacterium]
MKLAIALVACLVATGCAGLDDDVNSGRRIDVFGPYRGAEADAFAASIEEFEADTGIQVRYTGSANFVSDLRQRIESGVTAPDVAIVPQPGVIDQLADEGRLIAFDDATATLVRENYPSDLVESQAGEAMYRAPYRASIKSLVWYRPSVFDERGWSVPATLDELNQLVESIENDDDPILPWCFAIESGTATGWAATDWVEDLVLRQAGADVYDEWATGERGFDDPVIREALTTFDDLVIGAGQTVGGLRNILQTEVSRASAPLFADSPGCALYKQASFAESWFPDGTTIGEDVDFFVLPGTDANEAAPLVAGGDSLVQFSDEADVDLLMAHLVSPEGSREWARRGGFYSAATTVDLDAYYPDADRQFAELFRGGREIRFDASDVMPAAIGSGLLWREITSWIAGATTLDEFVATMDAAYADADTP